MTKSEMLREYRELCEEKRVRLDGIYDNSNKRDIQNAIDCLKCSDDDMGDYLTVIKLKYPSMHRAIINAGDYLHHNFNRLFVYNTARHTLAQ